jgi:hypothetical protein
VGTTINDNDSSSSVNVSSQLPLETLPSDEGLRIVIPVKRSVIQGGGSGVDLWMSSINTAFAGFNMQFLLEESRFVTNSEMSAAYPAKRDPLNLLSQAKRVLNVVVAEKWVGEKGGHPRHHAGCRTGMTFSLLLK